MMRAQLEPIGFKVEWVPMTEVGRAGHLIARHEGTGKGKRVLLIGHMDTVFEKDSPFQKFVRKGDMAEGPGVNDMKDGLCHHGLRAARHEDGGHARACARHHRAERR